MKIYAVADIHARQQRLDWITANVNQLSPDLVVVAGDLTSYRASPFVVQHLADLPVPVFAVRGNTDRKMVGRQIRRSPGISSGYLPPTPHLPFGLVGLNGTLPIPFRSRIALKETRILRDYFPAGKLNIPSSWCTRRPGAFWTRSWENSTPAVKTCSASSAVKSR